PPAPGLDVDVDQPPRAVTSLSAADGHHGANRTPAEDPVWGRALDSGPADIVPECDTDALFPGSLFSPEDLRHGAIVLYFVVAFYGFYVIAVVCEFYFLPTVEIICEELGLTPDVAAATFMSLASSSPELFVNVVTTFVTRSTMGVGTTVGSATFNVLGLASFIGLAARGPIVISAVPVVRDSLLYMAAIAVTTAVVWDGSVQWYEALMMVLLSLAYLAFMFSQHRLAHWARSLLARSNSTVVLTNASRPDEISSVSSEVAAKEVVDAAPLPQPQPDPEVAVAVANQISFTAGNQGGCSWRRAAWCAFNAATWPVRTAISLTIMDTKKPHLRRFYLLNFVLCVVWIALAAYVVSWMLAVIGNTLEISDAVMGITLLAAGGSTPEAVSAIIMSRKGVGSVGIANGLGANTLNMLMNLGMPWLVRSLVFPGLPWTVLSEGLPYDLVTLVSAVVVLNLVLLASRYRLCRMQGVATFIVYFLFIVVLVLIELNVFGLYHKSECTTE
ncbi:sodium/potassium/calcium exchanger 4-like, partial [Thrips palmi]|uniref:Sodium/potassium/calcium exchanger 4-like n=1 Tax=Thrips palmi TaxID=161013 RepID=A0A6P8YH58_THRPL